MFTTKHLKEYDAFITSLTLATEKGKKEVMLHTNSQIKKRYEIKIHYCISTYIWSKNTKAKVL